MKVAKIEISNILGIVDLMIEPGKITKITGKNGAGKSSVIAAVQACLKGGSQAELLRSGAESGEIVLVLDNGMKITKSITADETKITVSNENGKVSKPMDIIKNLSDALSVNPVEFLTADPKSRADYLLESMPMTVDMEELKKIIDVDGAPFLVGQNEVKGHALKVLEAIQKSIFTSRQDVNRNMKEKKATVEQLEAGLTRPKKTVEEMREDLVKSENRGRILKESKDSQIANLQDERSRALLEIEREAQKKRDELNAKFEIDKAGTGGLEIEIQTVRNEYQEIQREIEAGIKAQSAIDVVDKMKAEAERLTGVSEKYTTMIDGLKQYKEKLLANLPISGLEIKDGVIFRNGVDFDTLNTAQQIGIAVELAKLRAKTLGLICLDGAERLDSERFAELEKAISETDLQIIVTRVSDEDLKVEVGETK